jgi:pimeloyl-ACP methyl ester carboxylesterase
MSADELRRIAAPTAFCLGTDDPFLKPAEARPSIAEIPSAALHETAGGHGPWLEHPVECARVVVEHLTSTGFAPTPSASFVRWSGRLTLQRRGEA